MGKIEKPGAGWGQDSVKVQGGGRTQDISLECLPPHLELLELQCKPLSTISPSYL